MKKFLLFLMMLVAVLTATAQEVTGNAMDKFGTATISNISEFNVAPVTLTFAKNGGSTDPAYNKAGDCRIYAKNTITAACTTGNLTKIVFTISAQGKKRLTDLTPSVGTVTIAEDHSTITWEGNATEVVMTVGEKAVYGTDGDSKAGQICFTEFTATYEAGSATAAAAPSLPADCSFTESKTIEITNNEEGATVYYTTDGENFNEYVGEFTINETTTVIAYAQIGDDVATKSFEVTRTYTKLEAKTIAEVIEAGEGEAYTKGTVVATYAKGFLLNDETGYILVYQGNAPTVAEGDVININGTTSMYGGLLQFAAGANIEKTGTAEVTYPEAVVMDGAAFDAFLTAPEVKYVEYIGTLTINGNYYNVAVEGAETAIASIQYPNDGLVTVESGEVIKVTGYTIGYNKSYVNTMAVKVEAYVEPEPEVIPAANKSYTVVAEGHTNVSRPQWAINDEGTAFVSTGNTTVSTDAQKQFAFVTYEEAIYIYSISAKKFVMKDASLSDKNPDAVMMTELENGKFFFKFDADHNVNIGGSGQMTIDWWSTIDGGNQFTLTEAGDFDATEALALLNTTPEPEAPFEVVAVTPTEAVAELTTVTVEFSEEIEGTFDMMAMTQIYLGTRSNGCSFEVNGKVLTITPFNAINTPGEYKLVIPEGLITRKSNGEAVTMNGEYVFTVKEAEAPFEVVAVTPTEAVAELTTVTVEFSEEIEGTFDMMAMTQIYLGTRSNGCSFEVNGKVLTITPFNAINTPGEYKLVIPEGLITRKSNGEAVTMNGEYVFTVKEAEAPFEVVAVTPTEAVAELTTVTVEFSEEIEGTFDMMAMTQIYLGTRSNGCSFEVNGKVLTITPFNAINTPGEYKLVIPEGLITRKSNGEAVTMNGEYVFTVKEAVVEPERFTVTAALFPTVEGDVTEIKGIRVEANQGPALANLPTGWTLTNEAGDEFEMNIQWLYDYETILIMVNPAITEAGTYTLTIPAGSLKTDDGKECEAATFSWTVVGPVDPYMPYNNGTRTNTGRVIRGITLTGASGENSYALTADEQTQDYTDATAVVFKVEAGEELTITFDKIGEWIHQFVFIDFDGDGFTASIAEGSEWAPAEDLVAYSFYNNDSSSDEYGWNSVGTSITGNDRSTPAVPAFKAPETIGTYRMRVKQDWCNIDPAGDADGKFGDFKANGGQIIDVILEVVEATTGIENVEAETINAIYDITGRKIEKITEGGIYIVNGKKVLVK